MNRTLNTTIVTALAALAITSPSQAASRKALDQMMDNCMQEFVATTLADYPGKVTVNKSRRTLDSTVISMRDTYHITVAAIGKKSGATIATATCHMDHDGNMVSIHSAPLTAFKQLPLAEPTVIAKNDIE